MKGKKNHVENVFRRKWNDKTLNYLANDPIPNKIHRRREFRCDQRINLYLHECECVSSERRYFIFTAQLCSILRNMYRIIVITVIIVIIIYE